MLFAVILWFLPSGTYSSGGLVSLVLVLLTAYLSSETDNTYQLLRVRSRMIASVWLFGAACMGVFHSFHPIAVAVFCLAVSYYFLFRTYQQPMPVADVFHAFLLLSLGSIFYAPLLIFVPFYWWYLLVFMRSMSLRVFSASIVGAILPFWFWVGWLLWQEDLSPFEVWWGQMTLIGQPNLALYADKAGIIRNMPYLLLLFLSVWTFVYYHLYRYDDKIRSRMMFYIYMFQTVIVITLYFFMPDPMQIVPLLLFNATPLLAHYFTLCNTWLCLVAFFLSLLAFLGVAFQTLLPETFNKLC